MKWEVFSSSPGLSLVRGRRKEGQGPLDFEIWHFYITFLAKKVVFLVSSRKSEFHQVCSPLEKFLWLEKSANGTLLEKILSDDHALVAFCG